MTDPTLILFAKQPVAGYAKKRLQTHCTAQCAADISLVMTELTVRKSVSAWDGPVQLYVSPDDRHPEIQRIVYEYQLKSRSQSAGNIGQKMDSAIQECLQNGNPAALMGCDIPDVRKEDLRRACSALREGQNTLGLSTDGGFYFIGLQKYQPGLFDDITWSTNTVAATLIQRAQSLGMEFHYILECLSDVDSWDDLVLASSRHQELEKFVMTQADRQHFEHM